MFRVPDSVVVRRPITLQGVVVPAGTTLSKEQVKALGRGLNALLDSGYVVAQPDPFARKGKARPTPTSLPPVIRNAMLAKINADPLDVSVKVVGDAISVSVSGGVAPFTATLDGAEASTKSSRTFAFTGAAAGEHEVEVVDGSGGSVKAPVRVEAPKAKAKKAEE